jgi:hypothetical protein
VFDSEALQGAQVIPVAEFVKQSLLDSPELVTALRSEFTLNMPFEVGLDAVVVQQCVVNVYQKNKRNGFFHGTASTLAFNLQFAMTLCFLRFLLLKICAICG